MIRKLSILAGAVAVALGAQAYTYNFQYTLSGIGGGDVKPNKMMLVDSTGTTVAYILQDWVSGTGNHFATASEHDVAAVDGKNYAFKLNSGTMDLNVGGDSGTQTYQMNFSSDFKVDYTKLYSTSQYTYGVPNLTALLVHEYNDGSSVTIQTVDSEKLSIQISGTELDSVNMIQIMAYDKIPKNPENVPEPTSGLMLLLGVAGLALRRRRAA